MSDPVVRDFPDINRLLALVFAPLVGGAGHVGSETPPDLQDTLPFVRSVRVSGERTHLRDYPTVDIDYYDVDEATGAPRASALQNHLLGKPPPHPALDLVICDIAFRELPVADENLRRWGGTFSFETRRVRLPLL